VNFETDTRENLVFRTKIIDSYKYLMFFWPCIIRSTDLSQLPT